jgi:integrase
MYKHRINNIEGGAFPLPQSQPFQKAYATWKQKYADELNPLTYRRYTNVAEKHLLPCFSDTILSDITDSMVSDFVKAKQAEGNSAATIDMAVRVLGKVLKEYGLKPIKIKIEKTTTQKEKKNDTVVMEKEQVRTMEQYLLTSHSSLTIGVFLSLKMGMTLGEICGLQWQDVDFDSETVSVTHMVQRVVNRETNGPKTKLILMTLENAGCRQIPIPASLFPLLQMEEIKTGFVLKEGENNMPDPRTIQWRFAKLMNILKMPEYNYNALRTTFAVRCIEAGMSLENLSSILGHTNVNITAERYQKFICKENIDINQMKRFMA